MFIVHLYYVGLVSKYKSRNIMKCVLHDSLNLCVNNSLKLEYCLDRCKALVKRVFTVFIVLADGLYRVAIYIIHINVFVYVSILYNENKYIRVTVKSKNLSDF